MVSRCGLRCAASPSRDLYHLSRVGRKEEENRTSQSVQHAEHIVLTSFFLQGGKNRRRGTKENDDQRRELTFKEDGQEYAQVVKMLGNGRLEALCFDGSKRLANIRGKMRKKVWINQGDIILLSLRDFQDNKGDVILKYTADEARTLKSYGELPENAKINETDNFGQNEDGEAHFEFGDDDSDDDESDDDKKKEVDIDDI
ncbi:hypothetical protein NLG97_g6017 [Lecanicillium saksenae]|uniref:Uncharacterized protein n=1 Tax=Lecanicillium saksenae TaxID=468837 RepID=A0ACC1QQT5_9HYPO|nr:hypothetical protein NLG97_g6017 [Lecanicillium saksenae]